MNEKTELGKLIKTLVAQVNVEALSTRDLAKELEKLYVQVESLERSLEEYKKSERERLTTIQQLREELATLKTEYVVPAQELAKLKVEHEKKVWEWEHGEKMRFDVEKEYVFKECRQLKEILSAVLSKTTLNEYESTTTQTVYESTGNRTVVCPTRSKNEILNKPNL